MAFISILGYGHSLLYASNIRLDLTKSEGSPFTDIFCKHLLPTWAHSYVLQHAQGHKHTLAHSLQMYISLMKGQTFCVPCPALCCLGSQVRDSVLSSRAKEDRPSWQCCPEYLDPTQTKLNPPLLSDLSSQLLKYISHMADSFSPTQC